jgi:molybdopterin-containing oxidoreductase family iron-sulfur binding subunit
MPRGKGTVESCTLCVHKVDNGEQPACVDSVNSDAVIFGDLKNSNSKINKTLRQIQSTQIRADLNLNTGVRYSGI